MERDSTGHPSRACECEFKLWSQPGINFLSNYTTGHRSRKAPRVCGPCIPCWEQDPNKTEARVCHTHPCPPPHSCLPSEWRICIRDISVTQSLQSTLGLTSVLHSVALTNTSQNLSTVMNHTKQSRCPVLLSLLEPLATANLYCLCYCVFP